MQDRNAFLEAAVRSLADPVFILDYDGRYLDAFGGTERREYDSLAYLIGRTLHDVMPTELADGFLSDVRRVIDTDEVYIFEYTLAREDCEGNPNDGPAGAQWFQGRIAPLRGRADEQKPCVAWAVFNISERKRLEAELDRLAHTDELTGLMNRRAFLTLCGEWLQQAQSADRAGELQLAMVDLDLFKHVNDRYGHLIGDAVLKHCAQLLRAGLPEHARLARIGGEEFALAWSNCPLSEALEWMEAARQRIQEQPLTLGTEPIALSISAGLSSAQHEDRHPTDLLRRADNWLYQAKEHGRNQIAYPGWVERRRRD